MVRFRPVKVEGPGREPSWAVARSEPDGPQILVSRCYSSRMGAEQEAQKLNQQAASKIAG
jgi:hypothetical protein